MTDIERDQLIKNIFLSEIDYQIIKDRLDVLKSKPTLTSDETSESADYEKKLQHDKDVIAVWIGKIKEDIPLFDLSDSSILDKRKTILDSVEIEQTKERDHINNVEIPNLNKYKIVEDEVCELRKMLGIWQTDVDEISRSEYEAQIKSLTERLADKTIRLDILTRLKGVSSTWLL
ncbi:MAG: hypothetical protein AB1478_04970 [Nitrospirota bacterium]